MAVSFFALAITSKYQNAYNPFFNFWQVKN